MKSLFASTARGLEELLKSELERLGASECKVAQGGVYFQGDTAMMYRSLMWSRLASRILLPLREFNVYSDLDLYAGANSVNWSEIFDVSSTFAVTFVGTNEEIRDTQYGALRVKDAIVDSFMRQHQVRPNVNKQWTDIRLHVYLQKNRAVLSLDLSGEGMHQRGYRQYTGQAPLKENLAAAVILRSGWKIDQPMIDPMCGSGTLLIEAAMMAADIAPGLHRKLWGFTRWKGHDQAIWRDISKEAQQRADEGTAQAPAQFWGYDHDSRMITIAKENAECAGVDRLIHFGKQDLTQLTNPSPQQTGMILSNPPYGERLDSEPALIALYSSLGRIMKQYFGGWQLSLLSTSTELLNCLQLRADRQFKMKNGPLDCVQKNYSIANKKVVEGEADVSASATGEPTETPKNDIAPDFVNRLNKNRKKIEKWAKQQGIDCFRIYDADLPEYNVAVDRYADYVVIQEYAPPKTIDPQKARQRLFDIINATLAALELPASHLVLKTRERQKGRQQYEKLAQKGEFILVKEYDARLWVNLTDYLDTGLFLDHRAARKMIGEMSQGKDFLNLFAYTGSATVHAGLGGARSTTTVDMSKTYLNWAEKNLSKNGLFGQKHRLIQADCLKYIQDCQEAFDLIFIDPPTFSNSKRMEDTFDVQRDHIELLADLKLLLRPGGTIIFSNNKRNFKMDWDALAEEGLTAKDITAKTLSLDFERNQKIHNCWLIQRNETE